MDSSAQTNTPPPPQAPPSFPLGILFGVWLLVVAVAILVTFALPESFCSTARIRIDPGRPDQTDRVAAGAVNGQDPYFVPTELEVIQSTAVLQQVVDRLELNKQWGRKYAGGVQLKSLESLQILRERLDVRALRNTRLVEIRAYSENPQEAADVANAVAEAYRSHRLEEHRRTMADTSEALQTAYEVNNETMRALQTEIATLASRQNPEATIRAEELRRKWSEYQRAGQGLFDKIAAVKLEARLPDPSLSD